LFVAASREMVSSLDPEDQARRGAKLVVATNITIDTGIVDSYIYFDEDAGDIIAEVVILHLIVPTSSSPTLHPGKKLV